MRQCNMNYYQQRTIGKVHYGKNISTLVCPYSKLYISVYISYYKLLNTSNYKHELKTSVLLYVGP